MMKWVWALALLACVDGGGWVGLHTAPEGVRLRDRGTASLTAELEALHSAIEEGGPPPAVPVPWLTPWSLSARPTKLAVVHLITDAAADCVSAVAERTELGRQSLVAELPAGIVTTVDSCAAAERALAAAEQEDALVLLVALDQSQSRWERATEEGSPPGNLYVFAKENWDGTFQQAVWLTVVLAVTIYVVCVALFNLNDENSVLYSQAKPAAAGGKMD